MGSDNSLDLGPGRYEALSWLRRNKSWAALSDGALSSTGEAIKAVEALYAAGVSRVVITDFEEKPVENIRTDEAGKIVRGEGGPHSNVLLILFRGEDFGAILKTIESIRGLDIANRQVYTDERTGLFAFRLDWW